MRRKGQCNRSGGTRKGPEPEPSAWWAIRGFENPRGGFTLIELLVVIAVIVILASLLLPTLSKAKAATQRAHCISNEKQLSLAWSMYAGDYEELVARNGYVNDDRNLDLTLQCYKLWVVGATHLQPEFYTNQDNTLNPNRASFAPYAHTLGVYKCPADREKVKIGTGEYPRLRSYSMNCYLGWGAPVVAAPSTTGGAIGIQGFGASSSLLINKTSDLSTVDPASIFLFSDMNPESICHSAFVVLPAYFYHLPFTGHDGSGVLSFTDGHVETHRWIDGNTLHPSWNLDLHFGTAKSLADPNKDNPDLTWLLEHSRRQPATVSTQPQQQ